MNAVKPPSETRVPDPPAQPVDLLVPLRRVERGRGATFNPPNRFRRDARNPEDDGWTHDDEPLPPLATTVTIQQSRTIIARNDSPDIAFDRSIKPYQGCEHGCIYCFARPTHAFHDLSPGLDFETKLFAKPDAAKILREELAKPGYVVRSMAIGTNTDPYQPIEAEWRITRSVLEVLAETKHPVTITTKSDRVLRDTDILARMAAEGLARVALSVTSLTPEISRTLEPRAPSGRKRLAAVRALSQAGIPTIVAVAPVIPGITDHEVEHIVEAAAEAGAEGAFFLQIGRA